MAIPRLQEEMQQRSQGQQQGANVFGGEKVGMAAAIDPIVSAIEGLQDFFRKDQLNVLFSIRDSIVSVNKGVHSKLIPSVEKQEEIATDDDEKKRAYMKGPGSKDIKKSEELPFQSAKLKKVVSTLGIAGAGIGGSMMTGGMLPLAALIPALFSDSVGARAIFMKKGEKSLPEKIGDAFSQYNLLSKKSAADEALERGDAKRSKIVAYEEKIGNKFLPGRAPIARAILRPAKLVVTGLKTFEEKMLALTSVQVDLQREMTRRAIGMSRAIVRSEDEMDKLKPKNTPLSMIHSAIQSLPGGISQGINLVIDSTIKLPFKTFGLIAKQFTREGILQKTFNWFSKEERKKRIKQEDTDKVLEKAGLKMKLADRAYTFLADVMPQLVIDLNRANWKQVGILSQILEGITGITMSNEERVEVQNQQQERIFNAISGQAMTVEEQAKFEVKVKERVVHATQELGVGSVGIGDRLLDTVKFWNHDAAIERQQVVDETVRQAMSSTYSQQAVQFEEMEERRFDHEQKERERRESKSQKILTGLGMAAGMSIALASGGLGAPLAAAILGVSGGGVRTA